MKFIWNPIKEMDLDDGQHTCYSSRDNHGSIIWATQISDGSWNIEISRPDPELYQENQIITLANCRTLTSAKRWAGRFLK